MFYFYLCNFLIVIFNIIKCLLQVYYIIFRKLCVYLYTNYSLTLWCCNKRSDNMFYILIIIIIINNVCELSHHQKLIKTIRNLNE